ncbi:CDP-alcohol phosphatidyltransferase-domain-containing protein [Xylariomycetidae sp. FL2044]|nr:CDP-alcohol phosphatidyltransferase-domain-containing protein [Xylariomycetidae sp. FL2044]
MSCTRALRRGAINASRSRPSPGPRTPKPAASLSLSAAASSTSPADTVAVTFTGPGTLGPGSWKTRPLRSPRSGPVELSLPYASVSNAAWALALPGVSVGARWIRMYHGKSMAHVVKVGTGAGLGPRRLLSLTAARRREPENSKNQPPSSQPASPQEPPQQLKGIRKVFPKVLPSLTPHENIYTLPNILTLSRLIASPFIGYAILHDAHAWALGLFVYAGVSDLLDGWIARRWKLQTVVGSVVDPMADKMLMTVLTVCLAMQGSLPFWLATIILGRDVGLGIAAIYYRWISLPPPKTFVRYWDFSLPSAEVRPTTISKYNTFLQLALMGSTMVTPLVTADLTTAMTAFQYLVATTTVWSGLSYVFSKDAVKILSQNKEDEKKGS